MSRSAENDSNAATAGAWLLDNYYRVQEHIEAARRNLSGRRGLELPLLGDGPRRGLPRVYDLAIEFVSHCDGRLDRERLHQFFSAYQSIAPLTLAELCATADMLRLAWIEELCSVALRVARRAEGIAGFGER